MKKKLYALACLGLLIVMAGCSDKTSPQQEADMRAGLKRRISYDELTPEQKKRVEPFMHMGQNGQTPPPAATTGKTTP